MRSRFIVGKSGKLILNLNDALQVKRDKLLRPAGTELTAYGFGVLLDFWVSELKEALKKEGLISNPAASTAASGETAKDIEKRAMKKLFGAASASSSSMAPEEVPLPEQDDFDQGVALLSICKLLSLTLII